MQACDSGFISGIFLFLVALKLANTDVESSH